MSSTCLNLPKNWSQIILKSKKSIYFNSKDRLITFHPPFSMDSFTDFVAFYSLQTSFTELTKQFESLLQNDRSTHVNSTGKGISIEDPLRTDILPITDPKLLSEVLEVAKIQPIGAVLNKVCMIHFDCLPRFNYSQMQPHPKEQLISRTCSLLIKDKVLFKSDPIVTREESRRNVTLKALRVLIPSVYSKVTDQYELNRRSKEEAQKSSFTSLLGKKRKHSFNEVHVNKASKHSEEILPYNLLSDIVNKVKDGNTQQFLSTFFTENRQIRTKSEAHAVISTKAKRLKTDLTITSQFSP